MPHGARIATIEGQPTLVVTNDYGLPPKLDALLSAMFRMTHREDITPGGARPACTALREHRFVRIREGQFFPRSGLRLGEVLTIAIHMCADCGAVCVRDVSLDFLPGLRVGARGPKRRDQVIGWYSGARPAGREYR